MKVSTQQLLIAALAGGFVQEALALVVPNHPAALSTTTLKADSSLAGDIAPVNERRSDDIISLGAKLLPRANNEDNGDDGDSSVELYQRSIFARKGGDGHDGHDGHDGTSTGGGHDDTSNGDGEQSGTTGGLASGDDTTIGGLTNADPKDPPVGVCKRAGCAYTSAGYPDKPPAPSDRDKKALDGLEKSIVHPEKNTADVYTSRYSKERAEFMKYRYDPAQETRDEEITARKFKDNYEMEKADRLTLSHQEINDASSLGIKDPGRLSIYNIYSKTNGKRDPRETSQILVSDDGKTVVSSYTFAKYDGNLNKLDNKGDPKPVGKDDFEKQSDQYIAEHRLSSSDLNWAFLDTIFGKDKGKAQAVEFWMRQQIENKGTLAQMYRSHLAMGWGAGVRGKFSYKGDSKNPQEIKQYQALMGTENLSPNGFMYADHFQYFGGRFPVDIYTFLGANPNIWVKIDKPNGGTLPKVG